MGVASFFRRYRHREDPRVWAAKVIDIRVGNSSLVTIATKGKPSEPINGHPVLVLDSAQGHVEQGVQAMFMARFQPQMGGYYIMTRGGEASYLDGAQFEERYEEDV